MNNKEKWLYDNDHNHLENISGEIERTLKFHEVNKLSGKSYAGNNPNVIEPAESQLGLFNKKASLLLQKGFYLSRWQDELQICCSLLSTFEFPGQKVLICKIKSHSMLLQKAFISQGGKISQLCCSLLSTLQFQVSSSHLAK